MISYGTVCQAELDAAPATDDGEDKTGEEEVVIDFQPVNEATLIPNPPSGTAGGNTQYFRLLFLRVGLGLKSLRSLVGSQSPLLLLQSYPLHHLLLELHRVRLDTLYRMRS